MSNVDNLDDISRVEAGDGATVEIGLIYEPQNGPTLFDLCRHWLLGARVSPSNRRLRARFSMTLGAASHPCCRGDAAGTLLGAYY